MKKSGLYIHFPFCRRGCFYCHFFRKKHRQSSADEYLAYLAREIRRRRDANLLLDTVYIGGGSPSLLKAAQISALLETTAKNFPI